VSDAPEDLLPPESDRINAFAQRRGVRRFGKWIAPIAFVIVVVSVGMIFYSAMNRQAKGPAASVPQAEDRPAPADAFTFTSAPEQGAIDASAGPPASAIPAHAAPAIVPVAPARDSQHDFMEAERQQAMLRHAQQVSDIQAGRIDAARQAMTAPPGIQPAKAINSPDPGPSASSGQPVAQPGRLPTQGIADDNGQEEKARFFDNPPGASDTLLPGTREAALSKFEIRAGTVIPAVMIAGINSDLPGQILGEVRENVFDTATGRYRLIPQGSKLVGRYDSTVTYGQQRILAVWNRVIFPDGSSLELKGMPGADAGGYSGFNDQVDEHFGRIIGAAVLSSLFAAGIQLSQPQVSNGQNFTPGQTTAGTVGQQVGEAGQAVIQRQLNIAPTLEIRPGYLFNVMVSKDIILPVYN
jgi:type IV secretory pathway VirB10-like protein